MKKTYLPLILFILVVLEGLAIDLLPSQIVLAETMLIAHWVLMMLVYIAIYYDNEMTYYSVLYAVIFGLLIDITYTGILGVSMFSYGVAIYVVRGLQKLLQRNIYVLLLLGIVSILITDVFIYVMYLVVGITDMAWMDYIFIRLIPTILANTLFLLILYPIIKKRLERWGDEQLSNSN